MAEQQAHDECEPAAPVKRQAPESAERNRARGSGSTRIGALQAKLRVGSTTDPAEADAERVATEVVGNIRRKAAGDPVLTAPVATRIRRRATASGAEGGGLDPEFEARLAGARSGGAPLPTNVARTMGAAFGTNFDHVRIHTDRNATQLSREINARASTLGSDVFFDSHEYAPETSGGQHLLAHELAHTVQQAPAVARHIRRAAGEEEEPSPAEATEEAEVIEEEAPEEEAEEEGPDDGTPAIQISIGTVEPEQAPEAIGAGAGREDRGSARRRPDATSRRSGRGSTQIIPVFDLSTSVSQRALSQGSSGDRADAVNAKNVNLSTTTTGGAATSAFGAMTPRYSMSGVGASYKKGKVVVAGTLNGSYSWGTNAGGKIDVPSPTDPVVTAANYKQIVADLTPALEEKSWRAPRSQYWSKAICERHEQYHAKDETKWAKSKVLGVMRTYFKKNPIDIEEDEREDASAIKTKVDDALVHALRAIDAASTNFYTGGKASYCSYTGEVKAFGDGKVPYKSLASGVDKQGKKLEASAKKAK